MMNLPKVSIITPTFNSAVTLEVCIESVIKQNYQNLEHWFIDGLSTDSTLEIIKDYANSYPHIKYITEKDAGIYDAMNKGIDLADGEWLYFLGSDDEMNLETLNKIFSVTENLTFDFIYGNALFVPSQIIYDHQFDNKKIFEKNICHQAIILKRNIFKKIGKFNIKYITLADWEFNWRCFGNKNIKIKYINVLFAFFSEKGSSSKIYDISFYDDRGLNLLSNFSKYSDQKYIYTIIGENIFEFFKIKTIIFAFLQVLKAAWFTGRWKYYTKNGLYWTKKHFNKINIATCFCYCTKL